MLTASKALAKISFPNDEVSVELTGMLVFAIEVLKGTEHDLVVMDGTAFPLALAVLAYVQRPTSTSTRGVEHLVGKTGWRPLC